MHLIYFRLRCRSKFPIPFIYLTKISLLIKIIIVSPTNENSLDPSYNQTLSQITHNYWCLLVIMETPLFRVYDKCISPIENNVRDLKKMWRVKNLPRFLLINEYMCHTILYPLYNNVKSHPLIYLSFHLPMYGSSNIKAYKLHL